MDFTVLEVGKPFPGGKGHSENVIFEMDDSGAALLVFFNSPTEDEISQFKQGSSFEIKFVALGNIIMITTKVGNLEWMDSPYNPHLSPGLTRFTIPMDKEGLALNLILVDTKTGLVKSLRIIGLSNDFSRKILGEMMDQKAKVFNHESYLKEVNQIFAKYQTRDIVKMSVAWCKLY